MLYFLYFVFFLFACVFIFFPLFNSFLSQTSADLCVICRQWISEPWIDGRIYWAPFDFPPFIFQRRKTADTCRGSGGIWGKKRFNLIPLHTPTNLFYISHCCLILAFVHTVVVLSTHWFLLLVFDWLLVFYSFLF